MKTYFCCKHCGSVEVVELDREGADEMVLKDTCSKCHDKAVVDEALGYVNLKRLFNEYNKHDFLFDEEGLLELGQSHEFKFKVEKFAGGVKVRVWDATETFNIDTDENLYWMCLAAAQEFSFEFKKPASKIDEVQNAIKEAIKKDFKVKDEVVLEWEDGVVMSAWLEGVKA